MAAPRFEIERQSEKGEIDPWPKRVPGRRINSHQVLRDLVLSALYYQLQPGARFLGGPAFSATLPSIAIQFQNADVINLGSLFVFFFLYSSANSPRLDKTSQAPPCHHWKTVDEQPNLPGDQE